jgi:hypothetical protein
MGPTGPLIVGDGAVEIAQDGGQGGRSGAGGHSGSAAAPNKLPDYAIKGFSQDKVYVIGVAGNEDDCHTVIADIMDPDHYDPAFECGFPFRVKVSANNVYYQFVTGNGLKQFVPDFDLNWGAPYGNDMTPDVPCQSNLFSGFVVSPKGRLIYACFPKGWYELGGASVLEDTPEILALNDHNVIATKEGVMNLDDKILHPVGVLANAYTGVRVHDDTFHIISNGHLLSIDAGGNVEMLGTYPPAYPGLNDGIDTFHTTSTASILAPDDALIYAANQGAAVLEEVLVRQTIDGDSDIVYSEVDSVVRLRNGSPLVTGP